MLRDSTVAAVVRTRPRAIPLPMRTMRKSVHGFPFPYMVMGLRLATLRVGLSRSCSATFEQRFGFGATFSPSSNFSDFEHFFPF